MLRFLWRTFLVLVSTLLFLILVGVGGSLYVLDHYAGKLPDYKQLADYEPPVMTRVHAGDGSVIAEYAREARVFVPIGAIPKKIRQAFISAEDKSFYEHSGVDFKGVARAVLTNIKNVGSGRRLVGASTITQQVAKNFLLSSEVSFDRKIKEAILAFRIERALSKDRIMELYLNEIYLGYGSFGVAAAALNYFDKSLDELSLSEVAYLAALPKAPNNYHPKKKKDKAIARRNWVIDRMVEDNYVSHADGEFAKREDLIVRQAGSKAVTTADYFAEEVRQWLEAKYGEDSLYEGGLSVRTTLEPTLQEISDRVLREGLQEYDRRHGYRGPLLSLDEGVEWRKELARVPKPKGTESWQLAVVLKLDNTEAVVGLRSGFKGIVPLSEVKWARKQLDNRKVGPKIKRVEDVLDIGDVILVERLMEEGKEGLYALRQVPEIQGGLVALDPHTGRVLAMSGGFSFDQSQFNRATQANRQPGSAFKPFVYLAALDNGFTPSSLVLDAPFVIDQGPGLGKWKPGNYSRKFYGPSTLRLGVEKSRNLMTVRLARYIGMDKVVDYAKRFNIDPNMKPILSMALGSGETTLLRLTTAYAMLVNGGKRITPTLIDRVQNRNGLTVYRHDARACKGCQDVTYSSGDHAPVIPDDREQVADPVSAYQVVSMLEGVVRRGTGVRISRKVSKPLGGKTGTTNESRDTWFVGFAPDLAVGVYAGFDEPSSLGRRETGSSVAAPIFRDFMYEALEGKPGIPFRVPPGVRLVRVNSRTGLLAQPGDKSVILEAFRPGTEPQEQGVSNVLDGSDIDEPINTGLSNSVNTVPSAGTGGLY